MVHNRHGQVLSPSRDAMLLYYMNFTLYYFILLFDFHKGPFSIFIIYYIMLYDIVLYCIILYYNIASRDGDNTCPCRLCTILVVIICIDCLWIFMICSFYRFVLYVLVCDYRILFVYLSLYIIICFCCS